MNQQEIMQKIRELAKQIAGSQQPANTLEIAVLKNKCIELYECIQVLVPNYAPVDMQPAVEEIKPLIEQQINAAPLVAIPEPEVVSEPEVVQPELQLTEEPVIPSTPKAPEPPPVVHKEQPVLQEIFARTEESIHDRLSSGAPKSEIHEKLHSRIDNLKSAISLNMKIAFVNQLFAENTVEYAKAIDRLNSANTADEAMRIFTEYKHAQQWDNAHDLVKELQDLVEKRYS